MTSPDHNTPGGDGLLDIDIVVRDVRWESVVRDVNGVCRQSACAAFTVGAPKSTFGSTLAEAAVVLADDAFVATLNRQYRDRGGATNVLSFPATEDSGNESPTPDGAPVLLGDIVVARETTVREATESGISTEHHLRHLVVHGMFHLLGFDHMTDDEAAEMEPLETQVLGNLGVADPYGDDAGRLVEMKS